MSILEKLLRSMQATAGWSRQLEASGAAVLGWCGWAPAANAARRDGWLAVVDGAIYNRGDWEPTATAAELLLKLYRRHGWEETLRRLNGDFAAALYDPEIETLWLARDRFGVKPCYYVAEPGRFAFASRCGALLALPGVSAEINRKFAALFAASHYRYFDNAPEESPYQQIKQLPAAHYLKITRGGISPGRYWELTEVPDFTGSEEELADRYRELLLDAVALRLQAAFRPAFTLSGGMDSSSVLACTARLTQAKPDAFSTVYADQTFDESQDIQPMVAEHVGRWQPVPVNSPDVLDLVRRMIAVHDEPVATATWLSHFLLCQEVSRQGYGSLFGGLGGDELNAGEYEYFIYFFADLRAAGREEQLRREVDLWARYHDHPIYRKSFEVMEAGVGRLADPGRPGRCLPDAGRLRRYQAALNPDFFDLAAFQPAMDHPFRSYLKNRTFQDIFRETAPCCLRAEDRQTTAMGLGHFLPFFDYRLVEFMFRVPGTLKISNGVTKHLLRLAMRGLLPEETRARIKKTGWNAPAQLWFSGPGRVQLLDLVHSKAFKERGIYCQKEVERLIEEHEEIVSSGAARENHMMFLWQLVNLELWLESLNDRQQSPGNTE